MSSHPDLLAIARERFRAQRALIRSAIEAVPDAALHAAPAGANSLAVLVQHLNGSHARRWTYPLGAPQGASPAPAPAPAAGEFGDWNLSKAELLRLHEQGWDLVERALDSLGPQDLNRSVVFRGTEKTFRQVLLSQVDHYAYHAGQVALLAKLATEGIWTAQAKPTVAAGAGKAAVGA